MKRFLAFYYRTDKVVFFSLTITVLLTITLINLFAFYYPVLPKQIPLFYSLPWGENQLAARSQFVILPFVVLLTALINLFISWQLHESQVALKRLLCGAVAIVALLITITALKIIFIYV